MAHNSPNKTTATDASVEDFLAAIQDEGRRADAQQVCRLMQEVSGESPKMWGQSIVGFGQYHYKYASGREGDMAASGFSPRKAAITIYFADGIADYDQQLKQLGTHTTGKGCLYIKQLSDVDIEVLTDMIQSSYGYVMNRKDDMHRAA
jgi:hypothetical protein